MEHFRKLRAFLKLKFRKVRPNSRFTEFSDFFLSEHVFKLFGSQFLTTTATHKHLKVFRALLNFSKLTSALVTVLSLVNVIVLAISGEDFLSMVECVGYVCLFVTIWLKLYIVFVKNRGRVEGIIETLERHYPQCGWDQLVYGVEKHLRSTKRLEVITMVVYCWTSTHFIMVPFFSQINARIACEELDLEPIFKLYHPFDLTVPAFYIASYLLETLALAALTLGLATTDLIYVELVALTAMELQIVGKLMSEVDPEKNEEEAMKQMRSLVVDHNELAAVVDDIEEVFSLILFADIMTCLLMCCSSGFFIMSVSYFFIIKYTGTFLGAVWNGFIQCYMSDHLMDSSQSVAVGIYDSNWYNGSIKYRKLVRIVMSYSQKGLALTAFKVNDVTLETYQWILNTARSNYSILKFLYDKHLD